MDFESYAVVLGVHSTLRWLVLTAGLAAALAAWAARFQPRSSADAAAGAGRMFAVALDLQFVVGIVLYAALSPAVASALNHTAGAMEDPVQRFWMVEHPAAMALALVLAHVGVVRARRAATGGRRAVAWCFTLALLLVLAALPWPFLAYGRDLMPKF